MPPMTSPGEWTPRNTRSSAVHRTSAMTTAGTAIRARAPSRGQTSSVKVNPADAALAACPDGKLYPGTSTTASSRIGRGRWTTSFMPSSRFHDTISVRNAHSARRQPVPPPHPDAQPGADEVDPPALERLLPEDQRLAQLRVGPGDVRRGLDETLIEHDQRRFRHPDNQGECNHRNAEHGRRADSPGHAAAHRPPPPAAPTPNVCCHRATVTRITASHTRQVPESPSERLPPPLCRRIHRDVELDRFRRHPAFTSRPAPLGGGLQPRASRGHA